MKDISEVDVSESINQEKDVTRIGLSIFILWCVGPLSITLNVCLPYRFGSSHEEKGLLP